MMFLTISKKKHRLGLVNEFWENLEVGRSSFRYFSTRPINIVINHLFCTCLLVDDEVVGYGHLEHEADRIWLGIAVADNKHGNGLGKRIIGELINQARDEGIECLHLTVDVTNLSAIGLYERVGFCKTSTQSSDGSYLMVLDLSKNNL